MRTYPNYSPTVRPMRVEKTFTKVRLGRLVLNSNVNGSMTGLTARFDPTDGVDAVLNGEGYTVRLHDLESEESQSPRLTRLLDRLTVCLGMFYKRENIKERIWNLEQEDEPDEERINQLKLALTQVESDLSLDV